MSDSRSGGLVGGRYRLLEVIGRGGMGTVWTARDELLARMVAVKEVHPPIGLDKEERRLAQRRVLREARAAASVDSVAAVSVYDVLSEQGRAWVVMELVQAPTLADVIRTSGTLSVEDTVAVGQALVDALGAAHAAGVLHRDVKPANVLLAQRGAVLTDFGIAQVESDPGITTTGVVLGSPSYLPPERARGEEATPASDLWSLGATLYAALEGRAPFDRGGHLATLHAAANEPLPEPVHAGALAPLLMRLLDKDPAQRPALDETRQLLQRVSRGEAAPPVAAPVGGSTETASLVVDSPGTATPLPAAAVWDDTASDVAAPPAAATSGRRRRGQRLALAGLGLGLATALAVALATLLPDLSGGDVPSDTPDVTASAAQAPFQTRALYGFAQNLFDPNDCFVPTAGEYRVSSIEPDTELVKCVSSSAPYTGTFWCKDDIGGLRADRRVYLDRAVDGTVVDVDGAPAGRSQPADGIQRAFNHVGSNDARVYWDSEASLCAGELQATNNDDVDSTVQYWRDGA